MPDTYHSIDILGSGRYRCSCGQHFGSANAALGHVLPLNTRSLADAAAADPKSSPELIASTEAAAQEATEIAEQNR